MSQRTARLQEAAAARGYTGLRAVGSGLEFSVYEARTDADARVVLRTPSGDRFQSNANDPAVDTRALLQWEHAVTQHVAGYDIPVATARDLILGDPDVLISDYVPDDGTGFDPHALGRLLHRLHQLPPPPMAPYAADGLPVEQLLPVRITRRWRELGAIVTDLPPVPDRARMVSTLSASAGSSLVHLDVRLPNLRCVGRKIAALLDWSNALVGDPALEFGRLAEFARLPENGIDLPAVLAGYGRSVESDSAAMWLYRLDAAVMLALVFTSEAPDAENGRHAIDRLHEVRERLLGRWDE
ncbi:MAG: aminoglycoside phosphotransferase family protein [Actinobacteria bacterium]|nr:aminoglycoside phosphotransferase family protein [Actinomycetota bacterium]